MLSRLIVLAMQVFLLTYALRYVGFTEMQTMVLSLSMVAAIHIK